LPTKAFVGKYYLSGDTVELNQDGSISFVGRSDDVITTSGYRVGPFDVESALIEHPAVIEAAVIGKPDPERTELVKAFVVLARGTRQPRAGRNLRQHVRKRLYAHAYPVKSNSSASCPRPRAASCSASSCATRKSPNNKRAATAAGA
jgi:acetyl-CoA synthetase